MKIIIDPIYGEIIISDSESWVLELMNTDIFLRTKKLKQLGLCYMEFPSALQDRYTHSLGAFYLAKKLLERSEIKKYLSDIQVETIKAAALLHDIGHGPHSHGIEWYLKELGINDFRHEDYSEKFIINKKFKLSEILLKNNINPQDVADLVQSKTPAGFPEWTSQIISSEIDIDRLDYLLRDEYFVLGATNNTRNLMRIIEKIQVDNNKKILYFNEDDLSLINDFFYTRYNMYNTIYLSKGVNKWYLLLIQILKSTKEYIQSGNKLKDKYILYDLYKFMFLDIKIDLENYSKTNDDNFNLFITSLKYENDELNKLVNDFEKGIFKKSLNVTIVKNLYFYMPKKSIYIKKSKENKLVTYESVSEFSKLFLE